MLKQYPDNQLLQKNNFQYLENQRIAYLFVFSNEKNSK